MNPDFAFSIQTGSAEPIYRQLVEHVRRRVASGQIKAGDEIPSVRDLAQQLAVHPMTISKAYSLLEAEGLLERRRGMGMVVAAQAADPEVRRWLQLEPALTSLVQQVTELGLATDESVARFAAALRGRTEEAAPPAASLEPQGVPVPPAGADADAKAHPATRPST